jgi:hypothetical protein
MRPPFWLAAAIVWTACSPVGARTVEIETRQTSVAAPSSGSPSPAPAPAGAQSSDELWHDVVRIVTDKKRYPLTLSEAPELFARFGPLHREQPDVELLILSGSRPPSTNVEIVYRKNAKGEWTHSDSTFYILDPAGSDTVFKRLSDLIEADLGKPVRSKMEGGRPTAMAWRLRRSVMVWLSKQHGEIPPGKTGVDHVELAVGAPSEKLGD